ncbi:MAG: glycoside hydrolase family 55 protein [Planctomycetota bacterium]|nr:glycoside hydrolase family 55 protein [Planctomycetota bacterium]
MIERMDVIRGFGMTCFLFMAAAFAACPAWAEDDDTEDTPGVPEAADVPPAPVIAADSDDSSFYDLRRHGAVVGQDCTEVLQRALDTQGQHRKPILLPAGPLLISKTIVAPFKVGGQLLGSGRGGR